MNRDGSNVRRLTNNPAIDSTPTWSPSGTQIAFISDRTGTPQIWIIGADGLGLHQLTHESQRRSSDVVARAVQRDRVSPRPPAPAIDIKIMDSRRGRCARSRTARAATRARRSRRTGDISPSPRAAPARIRFSRSAGPVKFEATDEGRQQRQAVELVQRARDKRLTAAGLRSVMRS